MKVLQELYAMYYKDLYEWFYYRCGNRSQAEDLTQDTFVQVIRSLSTFQGKSSERTWLFGIARHIWLSHLRTKQTELALHEHIPSNASTCIPLYEQVLAHIKQKDEKAYQVFVLRMEGYRYEEIAAQLQCSSSSVRVLFHRSKLSIQKEWEVDK